MQVDIMGLKPPQANGDRESFFIITVQLAAARQMMDMLIKQFNITLFAVPHVLT